MRKLISLISVIFTVLLLNCPFSFAQQPRPFNQHEEFYHYVAHEFNAPELCEKISPQAFVGVENHRYRAQCYYDIAIQYGRQDLCGKVLPIYTGYNAFAGGYEEESPQSCEKKTREGKWNLAFALSEQQLIARFSEMGYKPETLYSQGATPQIEQIDLAGVYSRLGQQNGIVERIKKVTGPNNKRPGHKVSIQQAEFLYDLAAHVSNDADWCMRIRDDVPSPASQRHGAGKDHFRDTCIFQIASNTKKKTICDMIPNRQEYLNDAYSPKDLLSLRQNCYRQIDGKIKYPDNLRYSYLIPPNEQEIVSLIDLLGYPLPDIKDVPSWEIARVYTNFILELGQSPRLKNNPARQRFIENVKKLPSYK